MDENDFRYHPFSNPAARRPGNYHFNILLTDIKNGRLCRALTEVTTARYDQTFTYASGSAILNDIKLWARATYSRLRFMRWFFVAEGIHVDVGPKDWQLLVEMGKGAAAGALLIARAHRIGSRWRLGWCPCA